MPTHSEQAEQKTINDLHPEQLKAYRSCFLDNNQDSIRKNLGVANMARLNYSMMIFLSTPDEISIHEKYTAGSALCFSAKHIKVPTMLHVVANSLMAKNLAVGGIFRVNSTIQQVSAIKAAASQKVEAGEAHAHNATIDNIDDFDVIDLAETYKGLLRSYDTAVFPSSTLPIVLAIQAVTDSREKLTCCRALLNYLPSMNLRILEQNVYICSTIYEKNKNVKERMDMTGMSTVMMPCLFARSQDGIGNVDAMVLVSFSNYLFEVFKVAIMLDQSVMDSIRKK